MLASDYDAALLSEVQLTCSRGHWQVYVRHDGQHYGFGTFLAYADAHRACSASAIEKALGSPEKRAKREVAEGAL